MVLINVLDHVNQCYSNNDGYQIMNIIKHHLDQDEKVTVSFQGIASLNSSFVNSAFIELLNFYDFTYIKSHLRFSNSTQQINKIIKDRFSFEVSKEKVAVHS